jgi:hypothetical protein
MIAEDKISFVRRTKIKAFKITIGCIDIIPGVFKET